MSSGAGPRPAAGPVLELVDVVRTYPGSPPVRAIDGVTLRVGPRELFAIVGPSGSGKSTLLGLAGALDRPTSGTVRIAGYDVAHLSDARLSALRSRQLGFVFQQFVLIDGLSALANVETALLYRGSPADVRRARATAVLERVGMSHRAHHRPGELSGGERQRVAIARALVGAPALVLADEPTGNLDSVTGASLMALLHELHVEGATIGVVTHDHGVAAELPRTIAIKDGRIESDSAIVEPT